MASAVDGDCGGSPVYTTGISDSTELEVKVSAKGTATNKPCDL